MKPPSISVIIPVRDGALYIAEAIQTVLDQKLPPAEVIVIDDGSTDDTAGIVSRFSAEGVRLFRQSPEGISAARNAGVMRANGDLIAFLDADDLWVSDKLAIQLAALEKDPAPEAVCGHVHQFISPEIPLERHAQFRFSKTPIPGLGASTMLIQRDAFERIGKYEVEWTASESVAWSARAIERGLRSMLLPEVLVHRRLHRTNQGQHFPAEQRRQYLRIIKESLDRRRRSDATAAS